MREKNADFYFIINSEVIHVVQEYSYSGTRMSSSRGVYAKPDLKPVTAHKSRRHTFNFANGTWR